MAKSLNISSATYGRDTAGAKKLLTNLQDKLKVGTKALKGQAYTDVLNTVKANWSGVDADKFLSEFEAAVNEIEASYKSLNEVVQRAIEADAKAFASMQEKTATLINR